MPYMLTSQDSDQNLAEIVANGIYTHFANVIVEIDRNKNKWNIYVFQKPDSFITNYVCGIYVLDVVKIYIMPPVTRIIQGSENKEFLDFLQIKRWFSARNISTNSMFGSDDIGSRIVAVFELGDPVAIEVILDWIEYCGGITDGIASR